MKKIIVLLVAILAHSVLFGQQKNFIDQNYIEVQGSAELEVTPDELYVVIKIHEKDKKDSQPLEQIERQMLDRLKGIGIDLQKEISVKDYVSNFKYYWLKKSDILKSKEYEIVVKDMAILGKIYSELEKIDISNIKIDRVSHSEIEKFRRQVKIDAIKIAKEKASEMTEAIGQKITKAIHIQENTSNLYTNFNVANIMVQGSRSFSPSYDEDKIDLPTIEFQKIKLSYSVLARFEME